MYSIAQLDLSAGPLELSVPSTGDRYFVLQFIDAWTNNFAYVGTRASGSTARSYLVTPPGWACQVPAGVTPDSGAHPDRDHPRALGLQRAK